MRQCQQLHVTRVCHIIYDRHRVFLQLFLQLACRMCSFLQIAVVSFHCLFSRQSVRPSYAPICRAGSMQQIYTLRTSTTPIRTCRIWDQNEQCQHRQDCHFTVLVSLCHVCVSLLSSQKEKHSCAKYPGQLALTQHVVHVPRICARGRRVGYIGKLRIVGQPSSSAAQHLIATELKDHIECVSGESFRYQEPLQPGRFTSSAGPDLHSLHECS